MVYDRDVLADIAQLAIDRDLWIIFDERYAAFVHAPHTQSHGLRKPAGACSHSDSQSFSKSLVLTGWGIGYLAGPEPVIKAVNALKAYATSNRTHHALLHHLDSGDTPSNWNCGLAKRERSGF
ncbi:aminotransferase class I/II-fold pyridoxal phosphate-dependent enzyme [Bradyrhizobium sp. B124]|uniref:aminotransferase class I/II-fold pyridoxal phosphate-dependent enzyme n=1 Tax=Bradyrhizobium sp. B124 TaxID=3140245 RepID=UPI0031838197